MRIDGPFDKRGNLMLWATVAGVAVFLTLFSLFGPSPLRKDDVSWAAAVVLAMPVGVFVGAGLVQAVTLLLMRRRAVSSLPGWSELIWLSLAIMLGSIAFNHWLMLDKVTIPDIAMGGLGIGMFSMAIAILSIFSKSRGG